MDKRFAGGVFDGTVISLDFEERTGRPLYHVRYEDGDEEDWVATHKSFAAKAVANDDAPDMVDVSEAVGKMDVGGGGGSSSAGGGGGC